MRVFDEKQPYEEYYLAFDFTNAVGTETITAATVTVTDSAGTDKTSDLTTVANQRIDSPIVNVWVKGGATGQTYKITCKITTGANPSEKYELEAELPIVES